MEHIVTNQTRESVSILCHQLPLSVAVIEDRGLTGLTRLTPVQNVMIQLVAGAADWVIAGAQLHCWRDESNQLILFYLLFVLHVLDFKGNLKYVLK